MPPTGRKSLFVQEDALETRLLIAYGLIAAIVLVGGVTAAILSKKRAERRRRLRGIKDYN